MANKSLFSSIKSWLPRAEAINEAGGRAYQLEPKHALAQLAATGCFNGAYYATAETQLDELTVVEQTGCRDVRILVRDSQGRNIWAK
jgi:60 kDa SS-A/Ro ribonucleoprotein